MSLNTTTSKPVRTGQQINILLVDDRQENLLTLESIIEKDNRRIIHATNGNDALRLAIRENIGIILLDIQMPDVGGIEVAKLLRSNGRTKHIPIIFVSAMTDAGENCLSEFEPGTVDFISKPLNLEQTKFKVAQMEKLYTLSKEKEQVLNALTVMNTQMDHFFSLVAHDLNTPLRAIDNLTNWITDDLKHLDNSNVNENLGLLRNRVNRLSAMLSGIMDFANSRKLNETEEPVDLDLLAHTVFESLLPPIGFTISTEGLPIVIAGSTRMYKIFHHLISNAVKHHDDPANGNLKISAETSGDYYMIRFTDNGPGIRAQHAEKVFEMFFTLKAKDEVDTCGVGLSIVRRLLEDIEQRIWVEPTTENGCTVCITYPKGNG